MSARTKVTEIRVDPWSGISIPEPEEFATREQLFEHAALSGLWTACSGYTPRILQRTIRAYVEHWGLDVELPE